MSVAAMTWVWNLDPDTIPATERLVLLCLADYADEEGSCWPGNERIQQRTSLSERAIRNALRGLEAKELLRTQQRRRLTPRYFLNLGASPAPGAGQNRLRSVSPAPRAGLDRAATKRPKNSKENSFLKGISAATNLRPASGAGLPRPAPGAVKTGTSCRLRGHDVPPNHHRTTIEPLEGGSARARAVPRPLPEGWQPNEDDRKFADSRGLDPDAVAERFRLTFRASGKRIADWSARWRLWCIEDAAKAPAAPGGAAAGGEPAAAVAPVRDADGLSPAERAKAEELLALVRQGVPERDQRRIRAESVLRGLYPTAWKLACSQMAA